MTLLPPGRGEGIKTYDPKDVVVTFNGVEIKGYADGTFIEVERDDTFAEHERAPVGAKRSGSCTVTLMREAPGNEVLDDLERLIREQCTAEVIEKPEPLHVSLHVSLETLERLIERNPNMRIIGTSGSHDYLNEKDGETRYWPLSGVVSRLWSFDTEAFLAREAKKQRRRVRMARKQRRGWA